MRMVTGTWLKTIIKLLIIKKNKKIMKKTVLFIFGLIFAGSVAAQDTISLSLPQAITIALSENPTIKIADKEIKRVEYNKKEKYGAFQKNKNDLPQKIPRYFNLSLSDGIRSFQSANVSISCERGNAYR